MNGPDPSQALVDAARHAAPPAGGLFSVRRRLNPIMPQETATVRSTQHCIQIES